MSIFSEFKRIPIVGIAAFRCNADNTIYLFFSNTLITQVCTQLCKLRGNVHDNQMLQNAFNRDALDLIIVKSYEHEQSLVTLKTDYRNLISEFIASGLRDLRESYKPLGCKIRKYILNDFRADFRNAVPLVYVCATSFNHGAIVVGIFDSISLADSWIASTYGDKLNGVFPIISDDAVTKAYRKAHGELLLEIV